MSASQIAAELETDRLWREAEVRELHNEAVRRPSEEAQERMRRACVVLLYAHFEGYCRFALLTYAKAINQLSMKCSEVNAAIARAALQHVFQAMLNTDRKSTIFKNDLPEDFKLHQRARQQEFLQRIDEFSSLPVSIPDDVVNTESNLWSFVLRRNLFDLGLPIDFVDKYARDIDGLVHQRNGICHGQVQRGIKLRQYDQFQRVVGEISSAISNLIVISYENKKFLKPH